jgi:hypothetical protein
MDGFIRGDPDALLRSGSVWYGFSGAGLSRGKGMLEVKLVTVVRVAVSVV